MTEDANIGEELWESTHLPEAEILFSCLGNTWHDSAFHSTELVWMQKVKQHVKGHKRWPADGFYCSTCVGSANEAAQEYKSRIVTGQTLR